MVTGRKARLASLAWFTGQDEADARAGLLVNGFREAAEFHLIKDPLDALAQFLADPQVSADPRDARV